jgi:hypothetical protein
MQIIQLICRSTVNLDTNLDSGKLNNTNAPDTVLNQKISDNFEFPINESDTIFVLTRNNSNYKEGINNLICKMVTIKALKYINLDDLSKVLHAFGIDKLTIFSINNNEDQSPINTVKSEISSEVLYIDVHYEKFIKFINSDCDFLKMNRSTLYILRGGTFLNIKNIFSCISGYNINIGRGGSQKAHMLSPLDLRLAAYVMAMFNCKYKLFSYLNSFDDLSKDRYLSYKDKYFKPYKRVSISNKHLSIELNPLFVTKMPLYSSDIWGNSFNCSDIQCNRFFNKK